MSDDRPFTMPGFEGMFETIDSIRKDTAAITRATGAIDQALSMLQSLERQRDEARAQRDEVEKLLAQVISGSITSETLQLKIDDYCARRRQS